MSRLIVLRPVPCIAALALSTASAVAAETASGDTVDAIAPIETVTIIGHHSDAADVAGSAQVLDAAELQVFLQSDIMRVLRAVPGVYLQEEDGFGLRPNIGIRGSGLDRSARIALLEDGVLIAPAPYSAPSAYYFPTQRRMSAVEVLKGPASVSIGPRTTGGALNMVSTPIPDSFGASIDARAGDHGTQDLHLDIGNRGERISWLLETVQAQTDGFKWIGGPVGGDTGYDIADYVGKLQLDSDPSSPLYQSLRFKLGYTDQISDETYLGLTDDDFAIDPNMRYAASANDVFVSDHEQYQATYVVESGDNWRGEITAYRNDFARNWYKLQSVAGAGISDVLADPVTYASEFGYLRGDTSADDAIQIRANNRSYYSQGIQGQVEWSVGSGGTDAALTAGFRVHEDEEDRFQRQDGYRMVDGLLVLTSTGAPGSQTNRVSSADVRSVFIDAEIRSGKWIVTPGARFEDVDLTRLDYSTSDPSRSNGPTQVSDNSVSVFIPGIGALYRLTPEWRLLAGIHKGYNPPAPGSTADAESSVNFETGARYENGNLSFEGIYFLNDYDNLVGTVTESTGGGGDIGDQYDGGEVKVAGVELSAGYDWLLGGVDVPVALKYTWTPEAEFRNSFESNYEPWGDVQAGDGLPYIPEQQLRATGGLVSNRWRVNLAMNYIGAVRTVAGQGSFDPAMSIDSHFVWDCTAAWDFTPKLSTYLKVDNLFDETYIAARRPAGVRPGLPRTAYLGLTYRL